MTDINTLEDIKIMVDNFYSTIKKDNDLSIVLGKISKKNQKVNLNKMYLFWDKLLFGRGDYAENPFIDSLPIKIEEKYFDLWVNLFHENVDKLFKGQNADNAKSRATAISKLYQNKLKFVKPKRYRRTKAEMKRDLKEYK